MDPLQTPPQSVTFVTKKCFFLKASLSTQDAACRTHCHSVSPSLDNQARDSHLESKADMSAENASNILIGGYEGARL